MISGTVYSYICLKKYALNKCLVQWYRVLINGNKSTRSLTCSGQNRPQEAWGWDKGLKLSLKHSLRMGIGLAIQTLLWDIRLKVRKVWRTYIDQLICNLPCFVKPNIFFWPPHGMIRPIHGNIYGKKNEKNINFKIWLPLNVKSNKILCF